MAEEKEGKPAKALEDLERLTDQMESSQLGGESVEPVLGAESEDFDVVISTEEGAETSNIEAEEAAIREDLDRESAETIEEDTPDKTPDKTMAGYSVPVRQRILREIRLREASDNIAEAERTARIAAQNRAQAAELSAAEITLAMIDDKMKTTEARLKIAKDGGKVDDDIAATREMGELQAQKVQVEQIRNNLKAQKQSGPNPMVIQWQKKNRWFNHPEFVVESAAVRAASAQLASKYAPDTPEHFEALDRELRTRLPNLAARVQARLGKEAIDWQKSPAKQERSETKRQTPRLAAPSGGGFVRNSQGKRQITLTRVDLENMRNVRLDPNNKEHVLEYARSKSELRG